MTDKDDLLLGIMEKIADDVNNLKEDIIELKIEQAKQGVIHNVNSVNMEEHMARTEASENRLEIIEKYIMFISSSIKVISTIGAVSLFLIKVLPYLLALVRQ